MRADDVFSRSESEARTFELARAAGESVIDSYLACVSDVLERMVSQARAGAERFDASVPGVASVFREEANRFGQILEAVGELRERRSRRTRLDLLESLASEREFHEGDVSVVHESSSSVGVGGTSSAPEFCSLDPTEEEPLGALTDGCDDAPDLVLSASGAASFVHLRMPAASEGCRRCGRWES